MGIAVVAHEAALTQGGEYNKHRLLDGGVRLAANDGSHPSLSRVEGYCHTGLTYVQAVNHGQAAAVDRNIPTVAEVNDCIIEHSQEPWAMLARGTQSPILGEEEVGVVVHVHLKSQP
jgi:hypothetical protein